MSRGDEANRDNDIHQENTECREQIANWRKRTIFFLLSQSITLFGSTLVQMAIVWYVTLETSSGAWIAAFTICSYLPQFLISFIGGVWADRYSRKNLIIGADVLIAAATLVLILIMPYITDRPVLLGTLLVVSVIRSLGAGVQMPAVNAVISQMVPEEHLMRYNGINATMQSLMQFTAPAAAGVLLTFSTLRSAMMVDVLTAAVGVGILACVFIPHHVVSVDTTGEKVSLIDDMKQGIRYSFTEKFIGKLLIVYGLFIFLGVPGGFLAQLFVSRVYGAGYFYLTALELVGFGGMALGGLLMGTWGGFKSREKTLFTGLSCFGLLGIGLAVSPGFVLYLVLMFFFGISMTMVQTATTTLIQEKAEVSMQGRVFGLLSSMYSGFLPVGMALFGPLADIVELKWLMVGSGLALVIVALAVILPCVTAYNQQKND